MQIPSISQTHQEPSLLVSTKNVLSLQVGEIVQAEVLTVTDTAVAIRMKNTVLEARTSLPLNEGETLTLMVEGKGDEIRLRLIRGGSEDLRPVKDAIISALNTLKDLKPAAGDVKVLSDFIKIIPQPLKETLPGLGVIEKQMTSLEGLSGSVLKNAVQESGIFYETRLRLLAMGEGQSETASGQKLAALANSDMKAALLGLQKVLGNSAAVERLLQSGIKTDTLTGAVDNLLRNMEFLQLQSRLNDTLQVFLPFAWKDLKEGELIFRESERERPGEESYSCTVNLELERAGRMSARVLLQSGRIYVDVLAENGPFLGLLQEGEEILKGQFETAGIKLGGLSVRHEQKIDLKPSGARRLNIRI